MPITYHNHDNTLATCLLLFAVRLAEQVAIEADPTMPLRYFFGTRYGLFGKN